MSEIPSNLGRLVMYGTMPAGEIWASGFWISFEGAPANGTDWQVLVETIGTAMFAVTGWFKPQNVAACKWLGVKGYWHAGNPSANAVYAADAVFGSAISGTGSGQEQPNQIAMVATLLSGQSGRSFRGRMYIPATNLGITNGFIASGQVDAVANGVADLLVAAASAGLGTIQVVSTTLNVQTLAIGVRCTDKPDTQRRRSNRIGPTYQQIAGLV